MTVLLLAASALAAPPIHLDLLAGTDFPASVGGTVNVELPYRIRAGVHVGTLPDPYLDSINAIATGFGWYDDLTATLIEVALKGSLIVHPRVGWRPVDKLGFHFDGGLMVAALGGSLSGPETVAAATGEELPEEGVDGVVDLDIRANDYLLTVQAGWQWVLSDRLVVDATLGGAFSVSASSDITPTGDVSSQADSRPGGGRVVDNSMDAFTAAGEAYLEDTLTRYVHTPTVGVYVGYRFF